MSAPKISETVTTKLFRSFRTDLLLPKEFGISGVRNNKSYGLYGTFHSTTSFTPLAVLRCLLHEGKAAQATRPVFIDLGCGTGNTLIYAASEGWHAKGFEFCKECCDIARENIEKAAEVRKGVIEIHHTSFFPEEFSIAQRRQFDFTELLEMYGKGVPCCDADDLRAADLFYHYQVETRQNILNLFSTYAKSGALLFFVSTRQDACTVPDCVEEIDTYEQMSLFLRK